MEVADRCLKREAWRVEQLHAIRPVGAEGARPAHDSPCPAIMNMVVADITQPLKQQKKNTKRAMMAALADVVVDVSQNPARRAFTGRSGSLRTLTTSSQLADISRGRMLKPAEYMWLQGHNRLTTQIPEELHGRKLRTLAGEGMSLPCVGLVIWWYLAKQFPRQNDDW